MVAALDLGSSGESRGGSSPPIRTRRQARVMSPRFFCHHSAERASVEFIALSHTTPAPRLAYAASPSPTPHALRRSLWGYQ